MSAISMNPALRGRLTLVAQGEVGSPRVSGDGSTVVWNEFRDGDLEVMRARDGKVEALTDNDVPDMFPEVNRDGSVVAWTRESTRNNWDIIQFRDGQESVVADGPGNEMYHAVSDDGRTIVFDDDVNGKWGPWRIRQWRDGELGTVAEGKGSHEFPQVSGDGSRVVWRRFGARGSDLWMRDGAGTVKPIVAEKGDEIAPALSPDGQWIAYSLEEDLYLWNMQGGSPQVVAGHPEVEELWPDVSAGGRTVVWSGIDRRPGQEGMQIWLRDADAPVALTKDFEGLNSAPQISDDGKTIVWMWQDAEDTANRRIYRFDRE